MFGKKKREAGKTPNLQNIIDLTHFIDNDIMQTDVLGSYTGVPLQNEGEEEYETPVQDADDL